MTLTALARMAVLATIAAAGVTVGTSAPTIAADPHHPDTAVTQATPPAAPGDTARQGQGAQPGQPGMMGAMPMMHTRGHMMKIMFAVADVDGDGALSFEEVTIIHKRIFDNVDANKDGKVTPEEVQAFMRE
jgi:uncharacterized protein involved in copper resistance